MKCLRSVAGVVQMDRINNETARMGIRVIREMSSGAL